MQIVSRAFVEYIIHLVLVVYCYLDVGHLSNKCRTMLVCMVNITKGSVDKACFA